jgi:malate dehydrogenase (oxaloacetate-decarboxylating)(NADP+)
MSRDTLFESVASHAEAAAPSSGVALLHDPALNKGTAFTEDERERLHLRGLLPPRVLTLSQQLEKTLASFRGKSSDLEKYIYLISLQDRNERLFYRLVLDHLDEMMPIIYTPTVGQACQRYAHLWRRPRGLFISANDRGRIAEVLQNWPSRAVRMIVVTDGERILGLGDLGANGMGIPVGKLTLYSACAGLHPEWCLPITIDAGTDNESLRRDPLYIGLEQRRLRGDAYDALIAEFMDAAQGVFPKAIVQFEDFGNANAFRILRQFQDRAPCFNDDIQGTAAVTLAALWSAGRITSSAPFGSRNLLFFGAGEAGIGIAELIVSALVRDGMAEETARSRCWFVDSRGLVVRSRTDLADHKRPFAHDHVPVPDLISTIRDLRPAAIIGVSGQPRTFTRDAIEAMGACNERPIVFALSNPTSKSECTAEEAYEWTQGRAIFASGSPFPSSEYQGRAFVPSQANNSYIFPGVGLGAIAAGSRRITNEMFMAAARVLADSTTDADLASGSLFPPLARIRHISASIAQAVAEVAYVRGLATEPRPADPGSFIDRLMYVPGY